MTAVSVHVPAPVRTVPPQPAPPSVLSGPVSDPVRTAAVLVRLLERPV